MGEAEGPESEIGVGAPAARPAAREDGKGGGGYDLLIATVALPGAFESGDEARRGR